MDIDQWIQFFMSIKNFMKKNIECHYNINGKGNATGLTNEQMLILVNIQDLEPNCTVTKLTQEMFVSKSAISLNITKMEEKKYIKKAFPNENEDKRIVYIHLTSKGEKVIEDKVKEIKEGLKEAFSGMNEQETKIVNESISNLVKVLNKGCEQ